MIVVVMLAASHARSSVTLMDWPKTFRSAVSFKCSTYNGIGCSNRPYCPGCYNRMARDLVSKEGEECQLILDVAEEAGATHFELCRTNENGQPEMAVFEYLIGIHQRCLCSSENTSRLSGTLMTDRKNFSILMQLRHSTILMPYLLNPSVMTAI